jgi:hypothetical protein
MPQITGQLAELRLDLDKMLRDLDRQFTDVLVKGTQEWVRTVAAIVPNWSGMSRASLQPIAELVGVAVFASPVAGAPNRVGEGRSLAIPPPKLVLGDNGQYFFEWRSQVFHLVYNENNNANLVGFHLRNPGPYHSMEQAEEAFFRTVNPLLRAVRPDFDSNIKVIRHQINTRG